MFVRFSFTVLIALPSYRMLKNIFQRMKGWGVLQIRSDLKGRGHRGWGMNTI